MRAASVDGSIQAQIQDLFASFDADFNSNKVAKVAHLYDKNAILIVDEAKVYEGFKGMVA